MKEKTMVDRPAGNRDLDPDEADYSKRLYDAVLAAVIGMDADVTGTGGFVRPHVVRMTLADIAATIDNNCGIVKTPRDRRQFGEDMAKRYAAMSRIWAEAGADTAWQKAVALEPQRLN
jgi:hypothetical protein